MQVTVHASSPRTPWGLAALGLAAAQGDLDSFAQLLHPLEQPADLWHCVSLAGGGDVLGIIRATKGEARLVHFAELGVPQGCRPLRLIQTPFHLGIHLVDLGATIGSRAALAGGMVLKPVPVGPGEEAWEGQDSVTINYMVPWAPVDESEDQALMVSALVAYADGDCNRAAVDGHAALDVAARDALAPVLSQAGLSQVKFRWEQRVATLTIWCSTQGLAPIHPAVLESARRLAALRNSRAAHGGEPLTSSEVARPLAGTVAAWWWMRHVSAHRAGPVPA